ncbi:MAG: PQQ-binding-like beta-propeller repeat protein [Sphingomonas sp.]|uniref:outer membrane protein assembly factor BamB family protein n=1 Tax=Sphingomonas sp. TaxID=28214 RepID=UPI001B21EB95|nr:PQQ-binding-like beta-propeller repeat protein [Sphingomonas sp.]MBO9621367.1 PQQ-binding-like beta-propeller repeat protein [Sphingomonas sp.]
MRRVFPVIGLGLLAACSGGGGNSAGGGGGGGTVVQPPAIPTLSVTLDTAAQTQVASETDSRAAFAFTATYSGSTSDPIYPKIGFDAAVLTQDGDIVQTGKSYAVKLSSLRGLSAENRTGDVTFRLCRDQACNEVYPGSTQTFRYTLDVKLLDWGTFQRTPAHTGFVHATFDPQKIVKAWEWSPAGTQSFRPIAAKGDSLFVTRVSSTGLTSVHALNSANGTQRWNYDIGQIHSAGGPAVAGDQVHVVTMSTSSSDNRIVTLGATNGQFVRNMLFAAQWSQFAQPTVIDRELYLASGYYGNVVYGYNLDDGTTRWTANGSGGRVWDGETPAADDQYVYYYSGGLDVFRRTDGSLVKSIADPFWQWNGYSYAGGPILGARKNAIAYSGSGMGTYPIAFPLVSYDLDAGQVAWRTANSYNIAPALGNGVLFAGSNTQGQLDAIGEDDGKVRWSWPLPAGEQFVGNMIVTDNLLFFSTTAKVYAVSLSTHATVWSASTPGQLALSPDGKLIVVPQLGTGTIMTAYSLR